MKNILRSATSDELDELWFEVHTYLRERKYDPAISTLKSIIKIDSRNGAAYNRLAIVYAKQHKFRTSIGAFKKAHAYEPSASTNHNLGLIYYETKQYQLAAKHFERALAIDPDLAPRHIAMAKVQEQLGNESNALLYLKSALAVEDSKKIRDIYIDALSRYRKGKGLSEEMIEALKSNKIPWAFEALDDYEYATEIAARLHKELTDLVRSVRNKKLSLRSNQTHELSVIFLHDTKASLELIHKNYSHAALNVARSVYEIYLRISFAQRLKSYRGYAEIEKTTLKGKLNSNKRLLKHISVDGTHFDQLTKLSHTISVKIRSLDRRYPNLAATPSYRSMAIELDNNQLSKNYDLFVALYDKGSDSTHAEKSAIRRIVDMSGTESAGLFVDSHDLILNLLNLMVAFGYAFLDLPEVPPSKRKAYKRYVSSVEKSISKLSP